MIITVLCEWWKANDDKWRKEIELLSKEKIKMPWEMKSYKYLKILEADIIKHAEMKEKF